MLCNINISFSSYSNDNPYNIIYRHELTVHWQSFQLNQYEHLFYNNNTTYKYLKTYYIKLN